MLGRFKDYVSQQHLLPVGQEVLLAVSGGRDSVVMTHLFHRAGLPFSIAHCNFHLRPGDCDRDQLFVQHMAEVYDVPFYTIDFDTIGYAHQHSYSIEEAARKLRYDFFASICSGKGISTLATAHHREDSIETFFLNLFRGTGISGLHGIRPKSGENPTIIRPLLCFGRDEIDRYVVNNNLEYVEDHTNYELNARRNRIRLQLMPLLREMYPSIDDTMQANIDRLYDTELLFHKHIEEIRQRLVHPYMPKLPLDLTMVSISIEILNNELRDLPQSTQRTLLFELLRDYGFNASVVDDILRSKDSGGQLFHSATHIAELHRGELIIATDVESRKPTIEVQTVERCDPKTLPPMSIAVDAALVHRPLCIRKWREGDRFRPFGMKGSRLVSDFLKDLGLTQIERRHVYMLVDANDTPIWTIGLRADDRFRLSGSTGQSLILSCRFI